MPTYLQKTNNDVWIPEIIANEVLGLFGNYLNLGNTVARDSELTTQKVGDVINVTKRGTIAANQKAQGSTITMNTPTGTSVPVSLDQHWEVSIGEEDFTRALQTGTSLPGYLEDAVIVLAEKVETKLAALQSGFSTAVGETASEPLKTMNAARQALVTNKVPQLEKKYAYIHPTFITKLLNASAFIDPKVIPNNDVLTNGAVGRVAGIDIFEGQLVEGSGSPSNYQNLVYTRNAMCLATRPLEQPDAALGVQSAVVNSENGIALRVLRSFDHQYLSVVQTLDILFGTAVIDARRGLVLETA